MMLAKKTNLVTKLVLCAVIAMCLLIPAQAFAHGGVPSGVYDALYKPHNLYAIAQHNGAKLIWQDPVLIDNIQYYKIYYRVEVPGGTNPFQVTTVSKAFVDQYGYALVGNIYFFDFYEFKVSAVYEDEYGVLQETGTSNSAFVQPLM